MQRKKRNKGEIAPSFETQNQSMDVLKALFTSFSTEHKMNRPSTLFKFLFQSFLSKINYLTAKRVTCVNFVSFSIICLRRKSSNHDLCVLSKSRNSFPVYELARTSSHKKALRRGLLDRQMVLTRC